jgi:hypothetical protein
MVLRALVLLWLLHFTTTGSLRFLLHLPDAPRKSHVQKKTVYLLSRFDCLV